MAFGTHLLYRRCCVVTPLIQTWGKKALHSERITAKQAVLIWDEVLSAFSQFPRIALAQMGNYWASPPCVVVLGEQWASGIITSFVLRHQSFKEMTFPHENIHSAFVERLLS